MQTEAFGNERGAPTRDEWRQIESSLAGLRFGTVTIIVQDGVIIQIDRTEKHRLRTRRESGVEGRRPN